MSPKQALSCHLRAPASGRCQAELFDVAGAVPGAVWTEGRLGLLGQGRADAGRRGGAEGAGTERQNHVHKRAELPPNSKYGVWWCTIALLSLINSLRLSLVGSSTPMASCPPPPPPLPEGPACPRGLEGWRAGRAPATASWEGAPFNAQVCFRQDSCNDMKIVSATSRTAGCRRHFAGVVASALLRALTWTGSRHRQAPPPPPPSLKGRLVPEGWRAGRPPPLPGRELRSTLRSAGWARPL